jgi:NAD(P)H-dependent FMN reductase
VDWLDLRETPVALYPGPAEESTRAGLIERFNAADGWVIASPVHNWSAAAGTWNFLSFALDGEGRRYRPFLLLAGAGSGRSHLALDSLGRSLVHEIHATQVGPALVAAGDDADRKTGRLAPDLQQRIRTAVMALVRFAAAARAAFPAQED